MIKLWKCSSSLEMSPFSASSTAPREERKMVLEGHSPSHFQIISEFLCAADWNLMNRWAGLSSLLLDFGLGGWLLGHFSSCFVYRGSPVLLGFGPWWITEVLDLVHRRLKKWASTVFKQDLVPRIPYAPYGHHPHLGFIV